MITLKIHHKTTYRYRQPVSLGPHRLMLRPRESRDLRLISSDVTVTPDAVVTWAHDVFGNAVATASFQTMADNLVIDSVTELQHNATAWPIFDVMIGLISAHWRSSNTRTRQGGYGTGRGPLSGAIRRTRLPCSRT